MEVEGSILGGGKIAPHVRRQTECNYKKTKEKAVEYHTGGAFSGTIKSPWLCCICVPLSVLEIPIVVFIQSDLGSIL